MSRELDIERADDLIGYLRGRGSLELDETPCIEVLEGGVSNRAVLVSRDNGEQWVLKQALEKLRVAVEWLSSPERIHREADGIRWLSRLAPEKTITPLIFEDHDHHILAMEAVPQPHENWKTMLLRGDVLQDHVSQFGRLLGTIHRQAGERIDEIATVFDDRSFFDSLRLEPYYRYTSGQVPESRAFYDALLRDTWATRVTLVHGDYSPKNVLVFQSRLMLLDHEVVHFGDPAFDIGFGMTHMLGKANHLPEHRARFADAAQRFWSSYLDSAGSAAQSAEFEQRCARHTLGCLLARVEGRSPLEYLTVDERERQARAAVELMDSPPGRIDDLVTKFIARM